MAKLFPDNKIDLSVDLEMAAQIATTPIQPLTVGELIAHLQILEQTLLIVFPQFSEHMILTVDDIQERVLQVPRPDGWVAYHRSYDRKDDTPTQTYLIIG